MAPETIRVFEACRDHLVSQAFQGEEEQLKIEIGEAVAQRRYPDAQAAIHKLESAEDTRTQLADAFTKVAEILVSSGLAPIKIPDYRPSPVESAAAAVEEEKPEEEAEETRPARGKRGPLRSLPGLRESVPSPYRDRETFVDNAPARAMRAAISLEKNGAFTFESLEQIATMMLQRPLRRSPEMAEKAIRRYMDARSKLIKNMRAAAEETQARTVRELFEKIIPLVKNKEWEAFYKEAVRNYGLEPIQEFIDRIIMRQPPKLSIRS